MNAARRGAVVNMSSFTNRLSVHSEMKRKATNSKLSCQHKQPAYLGGVALLCKSSGKNQIRGYRQVKHRLCSLRYALCKSPGTNKVGLTVYLI